MASSIVSIINGRPAQGPAAGRVDSPNPSRLADVVAEENLADAATFAAACAAAKQAQQLWADIPAPVRGRTVAAMGRIVEAKKEPLARLVTGELGKPYAEALGEVIKTSRKIRLVLLMIRPQRQANIGQQFL